MLPADMQALLLKRRLHLKHLVRLLPSPIQRDEPVGWAAAVRGRACRCILWCWQGQHAGHHSISRTGGACVALQGLWRAAGIVQNARPLARLPSTGSCGWPWVGTYDWQRGLLQAALVL